MFELCNVPFNDRIFCAMLWCHVMLGCLVVTLSCGVTLLCCLIVVSHCCVVLLWCHIVVLSYCGVVQSIFHAEVCHLNKGLSKAVVTPGKGNGQCNMNRLHRGFHANSINICVSADHEFYYITPPS